MWPKEPLPLPCPGTWKEAPVVWEGACRTPLVSPFLPLPGPVWPEAEPASSRSSPRRPVSPPWRGGTSRPVPSPTLPRPPQRVFRAPKLRAPAGRPRRPGTKPRVLFLCGNRATCPALPSASFAHLLLCPGPSPAPLFGSTFGCRAPFYEGAGPGQSWRGKPGTT